MWCPEMLDVDDVDNFPLLPGQTVMRRGTGLLHRKFKAQKLDSCSELSLKETPQSMRGDTLICDFLTAGLQL